MNIKYIIGKTFFYNDEHTGKKTIWGKIIDYDADENRFIVYLSTNPIGYKIYNHTKEEIERFIYEHKIYHY